METLAALEAVIARWAVFGCCSFWQAHEDLECPHSFVRKIEPNLSQIRSGVGKE